MCVCEALLTSRAKVRCWEKLRGLLHFAIGIRYCLFILWFLTLLCIKACISCRWWVLHYTRTCRCPWQDWSRAELSRWSPRHNDPTLPCVGQTCNPSLAKSFTACTGRRPLYLLRQASTPGELCRLGAKPGVQGWVEGWGNGCLADDKAISGAVFVLSPLTSVRDSLPLDAHGDPSWKIISFSVYLGQIVALWPCVARVDVLFPDRLPGIEQAVRGGTAVSEVIFSL